jgi:SnoaL-like domain
MTLGTVRVHVRAWLLAPLAFLAVACSAVHVHSNVSVDHLTEDVVRDVDNQWDMALYARDPEAVLRLLAPDFEMETHQDCGAVTVRTRSDYDAFMRYHLEHALDFRWDKTIEAIEIAADRQSAVMRLSGTERIVWPSGTTVAAADIVTEIRLDQGHPVVFRFSVRCKPSAE